MRNQDFQGQGTEEDLEQNLRIAEALLGVSLTSGYWKMFTIVIQLGAILCLPLYFWGRIRKFVSTFPRGERGDQVTAHEARPADDQDVLVTHHLRALREA